MTVDAMVGGLEERLLVVRDVRAGAFGPFELPMLAEATNYRVRLEGSPIAPVQSFFTPQPGEAVSLRLQAERGELIWVLPLDASTQEVVLGAKAEFRWFADGAEVNSSSRGARPDGYVSLFSVPEGMHTLAVSAEGYATKVTQQVWVPSEYAVAVDLTPAAALRGRVLHRGEPVRDFTVATWPPERSKQAHRQRFSGRPDGRFELTDLPQGPMRLSVLAGDLLTPAPVVVDCGADCGDEVIVELVEPLTAVGTVVSGQTGEALSSATVQPYVPAGVLQVGPWGTPRPVGSRGEFAVSSLVPGTNYLLVEAPGHGGQYLEVFLPEGEASVDLGRIELSTFGTFELQLRSERGRDLSAYRLTITGQPGVRGPLVFSEEGVAKTSRMAPGMSTATVRVPDSRLKDLIRFDMPRGKDLRLEHWLDGPHALDIQLIPSDSVPLERVATVSVTFQLDSGAYVHLQSLVIEEGGLVHFEGIHADSFDVKASDMRGVSVSGASGRLPLTTDRFPLELSDEIVRVRVVDGGGQPIPDAFVVLYDANDDGAFQTGLTDDAGQFEVSWAIDGGLILDLEHGQVGIMQGVRASVGPDRRDVEVVLEPEARIKLRFLDGATPVPGVLSFLQGSRGTQTASFPPADPAGLVPLKPLAAGDYRFTAQLPGYWPTAFELRAVPGASTLDQQIRRLGDLKTQVLSAEGSALENVVMDFEDLETSERASTWIREGRIEEAALRTDADGVVRLVGIPHGHYRWIEGSGLASGDLIVHPATETLHQVRLP